MPRILGSGIYNHGGVKWDYMLVEVVRKYGIIIKFKNINNVP